jgi:hypothetical protein
MPGLSGLIPELQPWARWLISLWPYGQLTSTRRSRYEQALLYAACGHGECRYPAAPPGQSMHELGRAFDYVAPPEVLAGLGEAWEYYGGRWGGHFADDIHFEA